MINNPNDNITGGVSPLKAKRQASRGGKKAGKATATGKRRGGFAKSKGKRGAGGRNVGGYNVRTRFKADKWTPPASGGTTVVPSPKPYSYDKDGKLQVNPTSQDQEVNITTPGTPGSDAEWEKEYFEKTTKEDLPGYRKVWEGKDSEDANIQKLHKRAREKYKTFEDYVAAADKWWTDEAAKKNMSVEEFKNTYRKETTEKGWRWVKIKDAVQATEGTNIQVKQSQKTG